MTHVNILMVGRIVSETQTDRQLKFIIDIYIHTHTQSKKIQNIMIEKINTYSIKIQDIMIQNIKIQSIKIWNLNIQNIKI